MHQDTEIEFSVAIDQDWILPPGIEYFFVVEDGRGRQVTQPKLNPRKNPLRIEVSLDRTPAAGIVFPAMDNQRIQERRPVVTIRFADSGLSPEWRLKCGWIPSSPLKYTRKTKARSRTGRCSPTPLSCPVWKPVTSKPPWRAHL
jgi:hypothetical protein